MSLSDCLYNLHKIENKSVREPVFERDMSKLMTISSFLLKRKEQSTVRFAIVFAFEDCM